ncbi:MerR family DNA-binding transcriptional regulator [Modestobacter sp. I12A-02628]|uniref:MerR family DNA-binding transcriptional regulator n=1 Tax=Goekera deserti TaxID=2497753 RepID=A0A7K3WE50_9ACTN|nr:MerR family transcriptional regulator [Goekera deserti]MPQ99697.1 MerR family DNA-binding transcriptional regulator [Goekera deserti]NDI46293.1 MerR family DNA-binding transcriptional regulator [Goekera deserti]NEL54775.1 MerR family DNA-binding transcriptional regulator [Goekera deserti]
MSAVPQRTPGRDADHPEPTTPRLTIGEVLARLRGDFPDVTISKIRYLESEQLVHPQRTPSGYRKFSDADVARLRYVLAAQRDHYLPLRVIKTQLDAIDRGEDVRGPAVLTGAAPVPDVPDAGPVAGVAPDVPVPAVPTLPDLPPGAVSVSAADFAAAAGLDDDQLADCVHFGLFGTDAQGRYAAADLAIARAAAGLARHGIGPRHLRVHRIGAEREAGLVEQVVAPLVRARSEESRARAAEHLTELTALSARLHTALLEAQLRDLLRP